MDYTSIPEDAVVFDTETTGFDPDTGDRIVEIGAVKFRRGLPTKEAFHVYINPDRTVPEAAVKVHGLTTDFLADKPRFSEVVQDFLAFIGNDPLVTHNAMFDARFINAELARAQLPQIATDRFVDTVPIARKKFPGAQANLDALCRRFKISLKDRSKHGALIDSELLAEVCVELNGGRQSNFFDAAAAETEEASTSNTLEHVGTFVRHASEAEREAHAAMCAKLGEHAIWAQLGESA